MERKLKKNIFHLKHELLFIVSLLVFSNLTHLYHIFKHEYFNELTIRLTLTSILSMVIGLLILILFRKISTNVKRNFSSVIIVYLSLFFWLTSLGVFISFNLGFTYKLYLPIMALASFCILLTKHYKYHKFIIALLLLISISGPIIWYISIIHKFNNIKIKTLNMQPKHMIWAHRGYTQGNPENSLESFDAAQKMGYYGIELDVHFLEKEGFIVTHDIPQNLTQKNYLSLKTVFDRYRDHFYYWLDFKNLNITNAPNSGKILSEYIELYKLEGRVFVESKKAKALNKLKSSAPKINTIYWLRGPLENRFILFQRKYETVMADVDTVSIPLKYVNNIFFKNFSHLNIAVFTVNDTNLIENLFKRGVRIVLTDINMRTEFPFAYKY